MHISEFFSLMKYETGGVLLTLLDFSLYRFFKYLDLSCFSLYSLKDI